MGVFNIYYHIMKTAVIMKRDLNGYFVRQNSKTDMFNANDLLEAYNLMAEVPKRLDKFLKSKDTKKYIDVIAQDINSKSPQMGVFELQVLQANKGRINGGTWMHPYLFIDFAMWLSPEFKLTCVKWIYDKLIKFRNDSGDSFKEMGAALRERDLVRPHIYINEAHMLNKLVFGHEDGGQRNIATEPQLRLMDTLQKADAKLIREGRTFLQRFEALNRLKTLIS
jgi:hypothetical protein